MASKTELKNIQNTRLANASNITASELREVTEAIINQLFTDAERSNLQDLKQRVAALEGGGTPIVALAPPFNLTVAGVNGDDIAASVDDYPVPVEQYNWYLDGQLIETTAVSSYTFEGLADQDYLVGVSVTVNGTETPTCNYLPHVYDTGALGHPTDSISNFAWNPTIYFYAGAHNRTYIVWSGKDSANNSVYIFYYDHGTGEISDSVLIGSANSGNNHHLPSVNITSAGVIYVAFTANHNGSVKLFRTTNPEDISNWTELSQISGSVGYPNIHIDASDDIYITGRQAFDGAYIFKSTDAGVSFSTNVFADINGGSSFWLYHSVMAARKNQGLHIYTYPLNRSNFSYNSAHYLYSPDGVTFGNIEYYESGGNSGFSKDIVANGALTLAELNANFAVEIGSTDSFNLIRKGGIDEDGNPFFIMNKGSINSDPQIQSRNLVTRSAGQWAFTDISEICSLSDTQAWETTGIWGIESLGAGVFKVWVLDYDGGINQEITQYKTEDGGSSWEIERYVTRNSVKNHPSHKMGITHNYWDAPETIAAACYAESYSGNIAEFGDVRTSIKVPANINPASVLKSSSLSFDGNGDYADIPHIAAYEVTEFSVSFWMKKASIPGSVQGTVFKAESSGSNTRQFGALVDSTTDGGAGRVAGALIIQVSDGTVNTQIFTGTNLCDNSWHHVCMTVSNTTLKAYIDGVEVDSKTLPNPAYMSPADITLGRYTVTSGAGFYYEGLLDELQFWGKTLTPAEVTTYKDQKPTGNETDLLGYWPLDEESGNEILDRTSTGNDGIIINATYSLDTPI